MSAAPDKKLKYRNTLPAIPIEPKFLRYGFDIQRFTNFTSTTLEKNYIFDLNADLVTCNPIDLVDMSKWSIGDSKKDYSLQAEDAELLKGLDRIHGPKQGNQGRYQRPEVTWLRRTEYISGDFFRKQEQWSEQKKKRKSLTSSSSFSDFAALVDSSFSLNNEEIVHPTNADLKPVEILPVLPDFDLWKYQFVIANFDSEPRKDNDFKDGGLLKVLVAEDKKRPFFYHYLQQDSDQFIFSRDYSNHSNTSEVKLLFISIRSGCVFFNDLQRKLNLRRRRAKFDDEVRATKIKRIDREFNEEELEIMNERNKEINI